MKLPKPILQFLQWFPHQLFAVIACAVFIIGLFAGKAVMSIGMMLLIGNAVINLKVGEYFTSYRADKEAILFAGLVFLYAISFFWSEDVPYFLTRMRLIIPFLVLPFAFTSIKWPQKYFNLLRYLYVVMCVLGITWSMYYYLIDKQAIDAAYGFSKSLPTPFKGDHIRFSIAIVIAVSFCLQMVFPQKIVPAMEDNKFVRICLIVALVIFIIYIHVLASKTGLLSLYLILFYSIIRWVVKSKQWIFGIGFMVLLLAMPFIMFQLSDSFQKKYYYTKYAFGQLLHNNTQETNISDEGRFISYNTAFDVVKENPLLGVGVGDSYIEMKRAYDRQGVQYEKVLLPHNQFLMILLSLGIVGLVYFLYLFFYLYKKYVFRYTNLNLFLLIFIIPMLVEGFLDTQYAIALFLFFFLFLKAEIKLIASH